MLHLLHAPPLHVSTVDTGGDRRLGCWDLSYETLCLMLLSNIFPIFSQELTFFLESERL